MNRLAYFALGAVSGVVATAAYLGVRPPEPLQQVTILARRAPPPAPVNGPVVPAPAPAPAQGPAVVPVPPTDSALVPSPALPAPVAEAPAPPPAQDPPPALATAPEANPAPIVIPVPAAPADASERRALVVPVAGIQPRQLRDNFNERRGKEAHKAMDIMAPRGTPVVAVEDGKIAKLFTSKPGGLTIYQFDPTEKYAYYYAHLDRYAQGIKEGRTVRKGEIIGYVGSTGNAREDAPHLHFTIFVLGPKKQWWKGTAMNPYPLLTANG